MTVNLDQARDYASALNRIFEGRQLDENTLIQALIEKIEELEREIESMDYERKW